MTVSKRLRYEVMRRDNHICRYCRSTENELTIDHVVPVTLGGSDDPSNLVTACRDCNAGKSSAPADASLIANVADDAVRWAAAIQEATRQALTKRAADIDAEKAVYEVWGKELERYLPDDWPRSVHQFLAGGLTLEEIVDAGWQTMSTRKVSMYNSWRYFCGICWGRIRDRQTAAQAILTALEAAGDVHCPEPEQCQVHNSATFCHRCGEENCHWACGYVAGRADTNPASSPDDDTEEQPSTYDAWMALTDDLENHQYLASLFPGVSV